MGRPDEHHRRAARPIVLLLVAEVASLIPSATRPPVVGRPGVLITPVHHPSSLRRHAAAPKRNGVVETTPKEKGRVALIGAGPGDPELLTIRAYRYLRDPAALVVADRLVSREILALVAGELRVAGKRPGCAEAAQREIYDWVRAGVEAGRTVVRLKIGDPFVFGRGGEEVLHVRDELGVEPDLVPGISATLAAPLAAKVPVTHRGAAHQVVLTTGYGRDGSSPELPPYHAHQTCVFVMAVGRIRAVAETLKGPDKGFPGTCPALAIERASCPDQRVVVGDLDDIADLVETHAIKAPATIVFGEAVRVLHATRPHGLVVDDDDDDADQEPVVSSAGPAPVDVLDGLLEEVQLVVAKQQQQPSQFAVYADQKNDTSSVAA